MEKFFRLLKQDKRSKARLGQIKTPHGKIFTPAFVPVGSQATVKSLTPQDLKTIGSQVFFVNTYHLHLRPGEAVVEKLGGLHRFMGWSGPLMTDSGGFQVFSLAKKKDLVKVDYHGVHFTSHLDGSRHFFTPERSIEIQKKLGADMMVAFDECAPYPTTFEYARTAMERTHRWAQVSLAAAKSQGPQKQFLFGVIQGSRFKKLRQQSAQLISALPFDGWAIGGVAVGEPKKDMVQALDWVMPVLNKQKTQKPVHLLGVGEIDDIFAAAERGVDLMDCVMPTRLGRMGWILTPKGKDFKIDLNKNIFTEDSHPVGDDCQCEVCRSFTRAYLHHLFRAQELLAYHLATYHNLYFMERLFDKIRMSLKKNEWDRLKKEWLSKQ